MNNVGRMQLCDTFSDFYRDRPGNVRGQATAS
jgi:hypothetical protein